MNGQTIYALSSGPGPSGVAVIRFSGPDVANIFRSFCGFLPKPRRACLAVLVDTGAPVMASHADDTGQLDQALVIYFRGPNSFTGEDVGEFHVHGGRAVIERVLEALARWPNTRMAERGEFSRRAFENGKLDLMEAEGLADLILADTEAQREQALQQMSGAFSALFESWRLRLIEAQAYIEAALDFSDEGDVAADSAARSIEIVKDLLTNMTRVLDDRHRGEIVREGFRVVIAGRPNAGKSSLMNALARRDVAIVSDEAGTTRDVIEVKLDLDGLAVVVLDTAGLRRAQNKVEQEGIRRSLSSLETAHLVLWLIDGAAQDYDLPDDITQLSMPVIKLYNKVDLGAPDEALEGQFDLTISAENGAGLHELVARIGDLASNALTSPDGVMITRARHRSLLLSAISSLDEFLDGDLEDTELRAEDLRRAAFALGRVTGKVDVEDILDHLFFEFCIGK